VVATANPSPSVTTVPEPGTMALFLVAPLAFAALCRGKATLNRAK